MPDPTQQPVGQLLDSLGCQISLFEGDLPFGAVVLLAVNGVDGDVLRTAQTDGLSWLTLRGLITSASDLASNGWPDQPD